MKSIERFCPYCGSPRVFASLRQTVFERVLLRLLWTRPYLCFDCHRRHCGFVLPLGPVAARLRELLPGHKVGRPVGLGDGDRAADCGAGVQDAIPSGAKDRPADSAGRAGPLETDQAARLLAGMISDSERQSILEAMHRAQGDEGLAAALLGMTEAALRRKLQAL
jgi:hypothetical protein